MADVVTAVDRDALKARLKIWDSALNFLVTLTPSQWDNKVLSMVELAANQDWAFEVLVQVLELADKLMNKPDPKPTPVPGPVPPPLPVVKLMEALKAFKEEAAQVEVKIS